MKQHLAQQVRLVLAAAAVRLVFKHEFAASIAFLLQQPHLLETQLTRRKRVTQLFQELVAHEQRHHRGEYSGDEPARRILELLIQDAAEKQASKQRMCLDTRSIERIHRKELTVARLPPKALLVRLCPAEEGSSRRSTPRLPGRRHCRRGTPSWYRTRRQTRRSTRAANRSRRCHSTAPRSQTPSRRRTHPGTPSTCIFDTILSVSRGLRSRGPMTHAAQTVPFIAQTRTDIPHLPRPYERVA